MTPSFIRLCGLAVLLSLLASCPTNGQDKAAAIAPDIVTVEQLEQELTRLKDSKLLPLGKEQQRVVVLLTEPQLDLVYSDRGQEPFRVLLVRVTLANLTDTEIEVPAKNYALKVGNHVVAATAAKMETLTIAPGEFAQALLHFETLPSSQNLSEPLTLTVKISAALTVRLNVSEQLDQQLKLRVERIGPRQMLAVVSIGGSLNALSVWRLASELEKLATKRVARVVIQWTEGAPAPEENTSQWLNLLAQQGVESQADNSSFPPFPASIAELHVVTHKLPQKPKRRLRPNGVQRLNPLVVANPFPMGAGNGTGRSNVHSSLQSAVSAALASAYLMVPHAELVAEIQSGHPMSRAAALAHGGGRLNGDDLPLVLKLTEDKSEEMQRAALHALRNFGEPEAIKKLLEVARKDIDAVSIEALDSLAGSRFAVAHEALLELLQSEAQFSRKAIVQTLGRHPRPIWADPLYRFAEDPQSDVRVDALNALAVTGHPQFVELLEASLKSNERPLSDAAFALLAQREDRRSEQVAIDWTLKFIAKKAPTPTMSDLLIRTKEQRAVPLLLQQVKASSKQRSQLIDLLGQIGDQTVFETFTTMFDKVGDEERHSILTSLHRLQAPSFFEVAERSLRSSDSGLFSHVCNLLQNDATPKATVLLIAAFQRVRDDQQFFILCNALGNLSSPETRTALRQAVQMPSSKQRANSVRSALQNMYVRSQTRQLVEQGRQFEQLNQNANAATQYDLAVKDDVDSPEARLARGNFNLKRNEVGKAGDDYRKLIQLEPSNSQGPTGLGIVLAREGKLDEAAKTIESVREKFIAESEEVELRSLFFYNAACVYGRAYEYITAHPELADRDALLKQYERKSLDDLRAALKAGLDDVNREWMKRDPDLQPLKELPDFKKLTIDG